MTLSQLLRLLAARWLLIAGTALAGLVIALGWVIVSQKTFRATAEVIVNVRAPETVGTQTMADQLSPDYLATQMDVIRSDRVALLATQRLGIGNSPAIGQQLGWRASAGPLDQFIARRLASGLQIKSGSSLSRVIDISYGAPNALFASNVANAFAQAYIDANLDLQAQPARESAAWYERRLRELQRQLQDAQTQLSTRIRELGVTATGAGASDVEQTRLEALSGQLAAAQAQASVASARTAGAALPDVLTSPVVQTLQGEIAKLEAQRQQLSTAAGPNNPDYRQLVAQIAALRQQLGQQQALIRQGAGAAAAQAGSSVARLNSEVAAQKERVIASRARTDNLSVLQQDVRNLQTVYDQMAARRSQLDLLGESTQSNVTILAPAQSPQAPTWPRPMLMLALGLLLGTTAGIATVVIRELFDQRVRSAEDFDLWLGIPNFGAVQLGKSTPLLSSRFSRLLPYFGSTQHGDG